MNHADVRNQMPDYLEGDLPLDRRALFDAHLDECADCSTEIAQMRSTIEALRSLPEPEAPADLAANVMRRIRMGEGEVGLLDRVRAAVSFLLEPRVLAPASAAMLVAGLLLGTGQLRMGLDGGTGPAVIGDGVVAQNASPGLPTPDRGLQGAFAVEEGPPSYASVPAPAPASQPAPRFVRTPGQELIALSELLKDRPSRQTPFSEWPQSAPPQAGLAPSMTVASRSEDGLRGERPMPVPSAAPSAAVGREWPSSDEWLIHLQRNPAEFAERMSGRTLAEQELWVRSLARRAAEQDMLEDVVAALRASDSRSARLLADDFAAAQPTLEASARNR